MQRNKKLFFFSGLFIIIVLYTLYNVFLEDATYYRSIPRKIRHVLRFATILSVYGIGIFVLYRFAVNWMSQVWNLIYLVAITFLLIIGLYDWNYGLASHSTRDFADSLTELLISPVLFVVMGIIQSRIKK